MNCLTCNGPLKFKNVLNLGLKLYICPVCHKTFIAGYDVIAEESEDAIITNEQLAFLQEVVI
jgi:hypothetical protein